LVSVNVPQVSRDGDFDPAALDLAGGRTSPLLEAAKAAQEKIFETLEIKDWGLFINDD
jgi:hypothetical protein